MERLNIYLAQYSIRVLNTGKQAFLEILNYKGRVSNEEMRPFVTRRLGSLPLGRNKKGEGLRIGNWKAGSPGNLRLQSICPLVAFFGSAR